MFVYIYTRDINKASVSAIKNGSCPCNDISVEILLKQIHLKLIEASWKNAGILLIAYFEQITAKFHKFS